MTYVGFNGRFEVEVLDAQTKRVIKEFAFPNTITNPALDAICAGSASFGFADSVTLRPALLTYMALGTGSTTTTVLDTKLNGECSGSRQLASYSTTSSLATASISVFEHSRVWEWDATQLNGQAISELGLAYSSSSLGDTLSTPLAVHQLMRDVYGNPVTINKDSSQIIRVKYAYQVYPQTTVVSGSFVANSSTYWWELWPINLQSQNAWVRFGRGLALPKKNEGSFVAKAYNEIVTLISPTGTISGYPVINSQTASFESYISASFAMNVTASFGANDMSTSIGTILFTPYQNSGSDWLYALRFTSGNIPKDTANLFLTTFTTTLNRLDNFRIFSAAGTSSFTVPFGVNTIFVDAVAGGGGGGGSSGGGGGEAISGATFTVTPGDQFIVCVGNGGDGSPSGSAFNVPGVTGTPTIFKYGSGGVIFTLQPGSGSQQTGGSTGGGTGGGTGAGYSGGDGGAGTSSGSFGGTRWGGGGGGGNVGGGNGDGFKGGSVSSSLGGAGGPQTYTSIRNGGGGGASFFAPGGSGSAGRAAAESPPPADDGKLGSGGGGSGFNGNGTLTGYSGRGGTGYVKIYW